MNNKHPKPGYLYDDEYGIFMWLGIKTGYDTEWIIKPLSGKISEDVINEIFEWSGSSNFLMLANLTSRYIENLEDLI